MREKGVNMLVVKRSLAGRAVSESRLKPLFDDQIRLGSRGLGLRGFCQPGQGSQRQSPRLPEFKDFELKGGVMDGEALSAEKVLEISKWPNRQEQISMLVGQILSPGATLSGQLLGPGAKLASQVKKLVENKEGEE